MNESILREGPGPTFEERSNTRWGQTRESLIELEERVKELEKRVAAIEADGPIIRGLGEVPPVAQPATEMQFPTLESLVEAIEKLFECKSGTHRSYHTDENGDHQYFTLGFISRDLQAARQALYDQLWNISTKVFLTQLKPILYWRYAPQQRIMEEQDASGRHPSLKWKVMTRVAIPGIKIPSLEGPLYPEV